MSCSTRVRMLAVVRKKTCKYSSSLLVEHPVGSHFVLQCQREATGEICVPVCKSRLHAYLLSIYWSLMPNIICMFLAILYTYAEDMAVGAVLSLPNQGWATSQTAHRCLELLLMCQLTMLPMKTAMWKVCVSFWLWHTSLHVL